MKVITTNEDTSRSGLLMDASTTDALSASPLWNKDLAPTTLAQRTWTTWNIAALWIGMSVVISTYTLAGGMTGAHAFFETIYAYSWFITCIIGFVLHGVLMIGHRRLKDTTLTLFRRFHAGAMPRIRAWKRPESGALPRRGSYETASW